jgi:hypothetical protein
MRQQIGKNDGSKAGENSGSNRNGFISARKYHISGLSECLREATRGETKKELAGKWHIPVRTLTDIERLSAISFSNWRQLENILGEESQKLKALCPEGWGGNKRLITKAGSIPSKHSDSAKWQFIQWEVDVRIENERGDAEYQTSVHLQNASRQELQTSPLHSVWAPKDSGVTLRDIRAYDLQGELEIVENVNTPTFLAFRIKARRPISPRQFWRYWWEVSWPQGYADLGDADFTYKGESAVSEVILKLVLPRVVKPLGQPSLTMADGKLLTLPWLKLHGHDAIVFWQNEVPASEAIKIRFRGEKRKR